MPVEKQRPLSNGKPIPPKAPVRSKSGPYLAPKLANPARSTTNSELARDGRVTSNQSNVKIVDAGNITTPVKSFLSTNITPRSSSRRSRATSISSTANSTPDVTPLNSRPGSMYVANRDVRDLGERKDMDTGVSIPEDSTTTGAISPTTKGYQPSNLNESPSSMSDSFKFFHANDAISIPKKPPSTNIRPASGFVYADGRHERQTSQSGSQVNSVSSSQVGSHTKMFPHNGYSDISPVLNRSQTGFTSTTSPKLPHPMKSPNYYAPRTRSASPLKEFDVPGQTTYNPGRRASGASAMSSRGVSKSTISAQPLNPQGSSYFQDVRTHAKTQSISSTDGLPSTNKISAQQAPLGFSIQSPQSVKDLPISPSFFTIKTAQIGSPSTPLSPVISPDRLTASGADNKIDQFNSLAANARTERKVLDLEISNSSLLAINRTLEREMRKQKSELRRYRRLTQGGRLSFVPKNRAISGATTISTLSIDSDHNLDSEDENILTDVPSEDEDDDSEDDDDLSVVLSPEAQAEKDLRQRERDEKRLQIDLSKHQQLLTDSQKMNESLKRCLAWTEELIMEGKKAIDYQVRAGEVKLGGRVLHEDEDSGIQDIQPRHGLLSPSIIRGSEDVVWSSGDSPSATPNKDGANIYASVMADEGKEFREYLNSLQAADSEF